MLSPVWYGATASFSSDRIWLVSVLSRVARALAKGTGADAICQMGSNEGRGMAQSRDVAFLQQAEMGDRGLHAPVRQV